MRRVEYGKDNRPFSAHRALFGRLAHDAEKNRCKRKLPEGSAGREGSGGRLCQARKWEKWTMLGELSTRGGPSWSTHSTMGMNSRRCSAVRSASISKIP